MSAYFTKEKGVKGTKNDCLILFEWNPEFE
jgi:hypothetical protein